MKGSRSWISAALNTVKSHWHFHMDLLELWRTELSAVSLAAFVMRSTGDLSTFSRQLAWYDMVLKAFIFDTGMEPLVCLFDGEIRSDDLVYDYMSKLPLYKQVSDAYYNAKFEDVNEQFTDQFVGNFAALWGLIIPEWTAHALTSNVKGLFEARAHHVLNKRYKEYSNAGDFIKWALHAYSTGYKNYAPFITSSEIWRVYNPLIDLWYWTLASHIRLYSALRTILPPGMINPFIPGQRVQISINDDLYKVDHLTGEGIIAVDIPTTAFTHAVNTVKFDTYSLIEEIEVLKGWVLAHYNATLFTYHDLDLSPEHVLDNDPTTIFGGIATWTNRGGGVEFGVDFGFTQPVSCNVTIEYDATSVRADDTNVSVGAIDKLYGYWNLESEIVTGPGSITFHIPPRHTFAIGLYLSSTPPLPQERTAIINKVTIQSEEPLNPNAYNPFWRYQPDYDRVLGIFYPLWEEWEEEE